MIDDYYVIILQPQQFLEHQSLLLLTLIPDTPTHTACFLLRRGSWFGGDVWGMKKRNGNCRFMVESALVFVTTEDMIRMRW